MKVYAGKIHNIEAIKYSYQIQNNYQLSICTSRILSWISSRNNYNRTLEGDTERKVVAATRALRCYADAGALRQH